MGGDGNIVVDKNAELHMNAGSTLAMGGSGSDSYLLLPGLPGGNGAVVSAGVMNLGNVHMASEAGGGGNALATAPGLLGDFGSKAAR